MTSWVTWQWACKNFGFVTIVMSNKAWPCNWRSYTYYNIITCNIFVQLVIKSKYIKQNCIYNKVICKVPQTRDGIGH
jgi:hypothetical protein